MKLLKGHISPEMLRGCRVEEQGKVCHSSQGMGGNVFVLFCFFDKLSPTFSLDHKQKVVFLSISTCRNLTTYNKTGNMEHTYKRKKRERERRDHCSIMYPHPSVSTCWVLECLVSYNGIQSKTSINNNWEVLDSY